MYHREAAAIGSYFLFILEYIMWFVKQLTIHICQALLIAVKFIFTQYL